MEDCFKEDSEAEPCLRFAVEGIFSKMAIGKTHDALIQIFLEEVLFPNEAWQRASSYSVSKK